MYRLFTYMALMRYVEFVLVALDLAYLGMGNPFNKYVIVLLVTAIVYSLLAIASYSFVMNVLITLMLVLAITGADVALLVLTVTAQAAPSIGLYTACFINIILDALVLVMLIELIRR